MLYTEIFAVFFFFEIRTQYINTQCEKNVKSRNVKPGGTWSPHPTVRIATTLRSGRQSRSQLQELTEAQSVPGTLLPGVKQVESEADHSAPTSVLFSKA